MEKNVTPTKKSAVKRVTAKKPAVKKTVVKKTAADAKKAMVKKTAAPKAVAVKSAAPKTVSLKDRVIAVIKGGGRFASVATVDSKNKPHVRIMAVKNEGLDIFSASFTKSDKVAQIKNNNSVSITILKDYSSMMCDYIRIEATAAVYTDAKTKKDFWSDGLAYYFKGPDDPNYCVIRFKPASIQFNDGQTFKTEILKPGR